MELGVYSLICQLLREFEYIVGQVLKHFEDLIGSNVFGEELLGSSLRKVQVFCGQVGGITYFELLSGQLGVLEHML
jgi:hypothetical protein